MAVFSIGGIPVEQHQTLINDAMDPETQLDVRTIAVSQ